MGKIIFRVLSYIKYYLKRKDEHSLHSPFLFDFYTQVLKNKSEFSVQSIEKFRTSLLHSTDKVKLSRSGSSFDVNIRSEAGSSLSPPDQSDFIGSLINYINPKNVIELGTNFGISTSYIAHYAPKARIISIDHSSQIASIAEDFFHKSGLQNVEVLKGDFDNYLSMALDKFQTIDFVFFDGNHRYIPTIEYFEQCLPKINPNTVFLFHDIYWSEEMSRAWKKIQTYEQVIVSVDLFYFGLAFFRNNQPKQHFILKF